MKRALIVITLLFTCFLAGAQEKHLVRLGWGDSLFESLVFHPSDETKDYSFSGHYFTDYQYSVTKVFSVGIQADFQSICWTQNSRRSRNFDLTLMPTMRFTWLRSEWVRLYSGLGAGVLFAFDNAGGKAFAPAFCLSPIGIQLGKTNWCGSLDLGGLVALKDRERIYMLGSRLVSVSVNYCW